MPFSQTTLTESRRATVDAVTSLAAATLDGSERLFALNLRTARALLADAVTHGKAIGAARDVPEALAISSTLSRPYIERGLNYSRGLYEISALAQAQLVKFGEARQAEFNHAVTVFLDRLTQSAPAGSDVAVAAVRSAISATNSALDTAHRAARQVADIAEASVVAATDATARAVSAAAPAANAPNRKKAA